MATTREVRCGECWLRLHQLVLLRPHRNIRSTVGHVELSSEQHKTDPDKSALQTIMGEVDQLSAGSDAISNRRDTGSEDED